MHVQLRGEKSREEDDVSPCWEGTSGLDDLFSDVVSDLFAVA